MGEDHTNEDKMREYVVQMTRENEFWEQKFEKYYKKLSKLQRVYDSNLASLQAV